MTRNHPLMRPIYATAFLAAIALSWLAWGHLHARGLTDALELRPGRDHFAVTLAFAPEAFHVTRLQAIGRVIEVKGPTVYMMDVESAAIRDIATNYWVKGVARWPGR